MSKRVILALLAATTLVSSCGLRGRLERAPPMWGEERKKWKAEQERLKAEAEAARPQSVQPAPAPPPPPPYQPIPTSPVQPSIPIP
jgi:hypothetical protein